MVIGTGPAGLEAARALGQRGYEVTLLEARKELGGRVLRESALPGLNEWRRVVDWRLTQIGKLKKHFRLSLQPHGLCRDSRKRRAEYHPCKPAQPGGVMALVDSIETISGCELKDVFSPDDLMDGNCRQGKLSSTMTITITWAACWLNYWRLQGCEVTLVTPAPLVSYWSQYTLEQERIQRKLMKLGVKLHVQTVFGFDTS